MSSGDYGSPQKTDTYYLPFAVKHETGPWTFKLRLSENVKLQIYALTGFSDASPNFAAGLNIGYSY